MRTVARRTPAFTIIEVMLAIMIFGMIIIGIYAVWSAILKASKAGLNAAAAAQRARVSIKAIEDALTTAQMFSANGKYYYFIANTENEKTGDLTFVARLPATFPGVGRYGDSVVRRVRFYTDEDRNLIMTQVPMLVTNEDYQPYRLQLAKDVTLFMFEFWDDQKKEYVSEWAKTNQLPRLVRVALGLGRAGNSQNPQDLVTRTIAMAAIAIPGQWQRAPMMPGMPGMPGMPMAPGQPYPGQPGFVPGMPGMPNQPMPPGVPGQVQPRRF